MCGGRRDQTVGIGICTDHVQSVIALQRVSKQLSVDPGVVRDQDPNPLLPRTLVVHEFLQRHHSNRSRTGTESIQCHNRNKSSWVRGVLRQVGEAKLVLFGGGYENVNYD